jgi:hypothetical protein
MSLLELFVCVDGFAKMAKRLLVGNHNAKGTLNVLAFEEVIK